MEWITRARVRIKQWRQRYLIIPAIQSLQNKLPPISKTEREAIEAGNTWWEKELFCGKPNWSALFAQTKPTLTQDEQYFLDHTVDQLCSMLNDWEIVANEHDLPEQVWQFLRTEKFFGMAIPREYNGLGFSAYAHSCIITKIASRSVSAAVSVMVPNSLGPGELLTHYGTDEQKNYYLPRLATGEEIPCFALTAPEAGSDAGAIPDTGIVCKGMYNGAEVVGIRLNWDKRYITLAPIATVLGLAVHLYDPEHLLGKQDDIGITLCLIPTSYPGVSIGTRHLPMLLAFMNGPTRGQDVFIPLDWIIGGPTMAGQGWHMLMECLSIGRAISLPALSTACAQTAYRYTGAYARIRRQFHVPISSFEGIEEALGYIAGYTYILEACRIMTAGAVTQNIRPATASAIAKYHMTELSRKIINHAMDVHAGHTVQMGPRNFLALAHIGIPISITVEGANILTRNLIIFGQGAIRCHPFLLKEVAILSQPKPNIDELDAVLMQHTSYLLKNLLRNLAYSLTGGFFISADIKNKRIRRLQKQLTRMSTALALLADISLIILGGSLKRRERISARLGDIMSQLYLASTVLKYYIDQTEPAGDVDYVCWSLELCLYKIQQACDELFANYPNWFLGKVLSWVIFPFGSAYALPSDVLHQKIVEPMLSPSILRNRLTEQCYRSTNESDPTGRLDKALEMAATVEPLWKKLYKAMQAGDIAKLDDFEKQLQTAQAKAILTDDEVKTLRVFEPLRREVIKVDEFSFDLDQVLA